MKKIFLILILTITLVACHSEHDISGDGDYDSNIQNIDIDSNEVSSYNDITSNANSKREAEDTVNDTIVINDVTVGLENCHSFFLEPIHQALVYNWGNDYEYQLFNKDNQLFLKACLDRLYYRDNGVENHLDGRVKVSDYVITMTNYFQFNSSDFEINLRSSQTYDEKTDTVFMADGLGSVLEIVPNSFIVEDKVITIHYSCSTSYVNTIGTLSIVLTNDNYKYVSNSNDYLLLLEN